MKVEAIIPVRNDNVSFYRICEKFREQIERLKEPNDFGACIVDDCSTDGTGDDLLRYIKGKKQFRYFRMQERGNAGGARNKGIETSSADYLVFCDCDDNIDDDYCETLIKAIEESNGVDIIIFGFKRIDKNGETEWIPPTENLEEKYAFVPVGPWCKCVRRDKIARFPEGVFCEDCVWWFLQADKIDNIASVAKPLYIYDRTSNGFSASLETFEREPRTLEDLAFNNILINKGLNDKVPSDCLRNLALMYDIRNQLGKKQVREAWANRFHKIYSSIVCGRWGF